MFKGLVMLAAFVGTHLLILKENSDWIVLLGDTALNRNIFLQSVPTEWHLPSNLNISSTSGL